MQEGQTRGKRLVAAQDRAGGCTSSPSRLLSGPSEVCGELRPDPGPAINIFQEY
jgi:hypothetical protein